jgi:hypothetical protein
MMAVVTSRLLRTRLSSRHHTIIAFVRLRSVLYLIVYDLPYLPTYNHTTVLHSSII